MPETLFAESPLSEVLYGRKRDLIEEIDGLDRDYLLNASESDLCEHLTEKYTLDSPSLRCEEIEVGSYGEAEIDEDLWGSVPPERRDPRQRATSVVIVVPFDGDPDLFRYTPSAFSFSVPRGLVAGQALRLTYIVETDDADSLRTSYGGGLRDIEQWLDWVRNDVARFNEDVPRLVEGRIGQRKQKLLADADMVAKLGIPVRRRPQDSLTFAAPKVRRRPKIERPKVAAGRFKPEPALPEEEYDHILTIIENMVLVMERSPKSFASMKEEQIRDHILVQLNGHYEGQATGETFNASGKIDILIRVEGKNIFIAECMFWRGPKKVLEKVDQLLGYASWRDTKTALLVFNRNRDHSAVVKKVSETVPTHQRCKRDLGKRGETHFRYLFHQPGDTNRELFLSVLAFDVPSSPRHATQAS